MNEHAKEVLRQNLWYFIIAVLCLGVLLVFPFLRSEVNAGLALPSTRAGWFLFWFEKISITAINMTIFTAFKKQGKTNILSDAKYIEATEMLNKVKNKIYRPMSPAKYQAKSYGFKGTTLMITTMATLVAITNMILKFDYLALISYAVTLVFAVIFGIFTMKKDEIYWTNDYWFYAKEQYDKNLNTEENQENDLER